MYRYTFSQSQRFYDEVPLNSAFIPHQNGLYTAATHYGTFYDNQNRYFNVKQSQKQKNFKFNNKMHQVQSGRHLEKKNTIFNINEKTKIIPKTADVIRIASYNIMRDFVHEEHTNHLKWHQREDRILKTIANIDADILCLQECNDLPNYDILSFLEKLSDQLHYTYSVHTDTQNNNTKKLRVTTLYKSPIQCVEKQTFWLSPNPISSVPAYEWQQKVARPIGMNAFTIPTTKDKLLYVWNTHFGHHFDEKHKSALLVPQLMKKYTGMNNFGVLCGDFNTFSQNNQGDFLRNTICNSSLPDFSLMNLGEKSKTYLGSSSDKGTFVGTSIDRYKPPLGTIGDQLDHIFITNNCLTNKKNTPELIIYNSTELPNEPEYLQQYDQFPSDHLAIFCDLPFC